MGWINFWLAKYIKINEIIKPNSKLPLSPKNSFGSLRKEKLKHKKIIIGINNSENLKEIINFKTIDKNKMINFKISDTKLIDPRYWR